MQGEAIVGARAGADSRRVARAAWGSTVFRSVGTVLSECYGFRSPFPPLARSPARKVDGVFAESRREFLFSGSVGAAASVILGLIVGTARAP
jgi:hypothetical protein